MVTMLNYHLKTHPNGSDINWLYRENDKLPSYRDFQARFDYLVNELTGINLNINISKSVYFSMDKVRFKNKYQKFHIPLGSNIGFENAIL